MSHTANVIIGSTVYLVFLVMISFIIGKQKNDWDLASPVMGMFALIAGIYGLVCYLLGTI